ncbi:BlaI/MecI/CopY family transcriptional regulator [Sulfitobacter sp. LCG007]
MVKRRAKANLLTEVELEFMNGLWALGQGSVRDVLDWLPPERDLAYTSGATILRILDQKGFVESRKQGKTLFYVPLLEKDKYQTRSLQNLSRTLFDGTPASMVARLVDDAGLTASDLEDIRALVERRLRDDSDETGS